MTPTEQKGLPELPRPAGTSNFHYDGGVRQQHVYTADQMRAYAQQVAAAKDAERAQVVEQNVQLEETLGVRCRQLLEAEAERDALRARVAWPWQIEPGDSVAIIKSTKYGRGISFNTVEACAEFCRWPFQGTTPPEGDHND